ncbi:cardiolipin synthase [Niallia taxi]|uniref:cardiolipin synthase n=1 Tax=Niallia taxi TaxID=2499688 RepID=UPI0023A97A8D|nr:cardiolipin synthase [Niallia taxi]MDE5053767.1 cardiolipin synthase [Niallia taxi]WOD63411.1 cardiolipin synthase [Niallia taxi]
MYTFLIIIGILLLLIFLLYIDFIVGKAITKRKVTRRNYPFRESNFQIFNDGKDLFPDLFQELENAEKHIHILFYTVKADTISTQFLEILERKAQDGIEVRLLLDWLGSFQIRKKIRNKLKEAGVEFAYCNRPTLPFFYSLQVRNHRKISIIDGKISYVGGFNIGKDYIHANLKLSPWRDYHFKMTGEGVEDLQREFLLDWTDATKTNLLQNPIYFPEQPKGNARHQIIPTQGVYLEDVLCGLIRNTRKTLFIGTPYFIPSKRIMKELCMAQDRNVTITLLLPTKPDHILVKEASFPYLRTLLKGGARAYHYKHGFFHGKIITADDEICLVGTPNFDKRSIFLNHELVCCIFEPSFITEMNSIVDKDIAVSEKYTLEYLEKPKPKTVLLEWIAKLFAPLL